MIETEPCRAELSRAHQMKAPFEQSQVLNGAEAFYVHCLAIFSVRNDDARISAHKR